MAELLPNLACFECHSFTWIDAMLRREFLTTRRPAYRRRFSCQQLAMTARANGGELLPAARTHHAARAKHLIFVFLTGGFSHVDTFDPKPRLQADHGKPISGESLRDISRGTAARFAIPLRPLRRIGNGNQ